MKIDHIKEAFNEWFAVEKAGLPSNHLAEAVKQAAWEWMSYHSEKFRSTLNPERMELVDFYAHIFRACDERQELREKIMKVIYPGLCESLEDRIS